MECEVPFVDLKAQYAGIRAEIESAVKGVVESARFVGGPVLERFEQEFAAFTGARFAVGVGNGTDAITLALRAAEIGRGAEVLVPANSFFASAEAVSECRRNPGLCRRQSAHLPHGSAICGRSHHRSHPSHPARAPVRASPRVAAFRRAGRGSWPGSRGGLRSGPRRAHRRTNPWGLGTAHLLQLLPGQKPRRLRRWRSSHDQRCRDQQPPAHTSRPRQRAQV